MVEIKGSFEGQLYRWLVKKDKLSHLDVPGRHQSPALPLNLGDHNGDAVPLVPGKVGDLAQKQVLFTVHMYFISPDTPARSR